MTPLKSAKFINQKTQKMEPKEKYTASHIANYFLWRAWEEGVKDMTPMKLIKLVYIAYGWNLVMNHKDKYLFEEPILAWDYGPVIPSLYYEFREFGKNPIPKGNYSAVFDDYEAFGGETRALESVPMVDDDHILKILNAEWNHYKNLDGVELSRITHREGSPWHKAIKHGRNTRLEDNNIVDASSEKIDELMNQSGVS